MKSNENEENFQKLIDSHELLNQSYKKLLGDHEELQNLYIHLESDYDELYSDLSKKHLLLNNFNTELDELKEKYTASLANVEEKEKKLSFYESKTHSTMETNTDLHGDFMSKRLNEIEKAYEAKMRVLNSEIKDLKEKVKKLNKKLKIQI